MSTVDWTPDAIAHALPDSGMRMEFLRQLNTTPFSELEALGAKWSAVVAELQAAVERGRAVRAYQQEHEGQLPPEFVDVTEAIKESRAA